MTPHKTNADLSRLFLPHEASAKNFRPLVAGRPILARQPRPCVWRVHDPHSKGSGVLGLANRDAITDCVHRLLASRGPPAPITGLSSQGTDYGGKQIEHLGEIVPRLHRIGGIANAGSRGALGEMRAFEATAKALGSRSQVSKSARGAAGLTPRASHWKIRSAARSTGMRR